MNDNKGITKKKLTETVSKQRNTKDTRNVFKMFKSDVSALDLALRWKEITNLAGHFT